MVRNDPVMQPYEAADAFTSMLYAVDAKDWPRVRRAFADRVDVDYRSLSGAPPARVAADDLVAGWQSFLGGFEATQHMTGPILLTLQADTVVAHTHVRAYHRRSAADGEIWLVAGHYEARLERASDTWRITALKLHVFYQEGTGSVVRASR